MPILWSALKVLGIALLVFGAFVCDAVRCQRCGGYHGGYFCFRPIHRPPFWWPF